MRDDARNEMHEYEAHQAILVLQSNKYSIFLILIIAHLRLGGGTVTDAKVGGAGLITLDCHGTVADLITKEAKSSVPDDLLLTIIVAVGAKVAGATVAVTQDGKESTISLLGVLLVLLDELPLAEVRPLLLVALVLALFVEGVLALVLVIALTSGVLLLGSPLGQSAMKWSVFSHS
ncbi:hypothetical protein U9M48_003431 [Paspalum notatum var. saurae]|uniref:Uncharacterized protein n=1 Tax=Paspalum notatum var. saurae TaxID=547442 RepID=A0AAQ3PLH7_PASNO